MGMSSSQARLLNLTARQHDIEYDVQRLEARKMQLANESDQVYNTYLDALSSTKIQYDFHTSFGEVITKDATLSGLENGFLGESGCCNQPMFLTSIDGTRLFVTPAIEGKYDLTGVSRGKYSDLNNYLESLNLLKANVYNDPPVVNMSDLRAFTKENVDSIVFTSTLQDIANGTTVVSINNVDEFLSFAKVMNSGTPLADALKTATIKFEPLEFHKDQDLHNPTEWDFFDEYTDSAGNICLEDIAGCSTALIKEFNGTIYGLNVSGIKCPIFDTLGENAKIYNATIENSTLDPNKYVNKSGSNVDNDSWGLLANNIYGSENSGIYGYEVANCYINNYDLPESTNISYLAGTINGIERMDAVNINNYPSCNCTYYDFDGISSYKGFRVGNVSSGSILNITNSIDVYDIYKKTYGMGEAISPVEAVRCGAVDGYYFAKADADGQITQVDEIKYFNGRGPTYYAGTTTPRYTENYVIEKGGVAIEHEEIEHVGLSAPNGSDHVPVLLDQYVVVDAAADQYRGLASTSTRSLDNIRYDAELNPDDYCYVNKSTIPSAADVANNVYLAFTLLSAQSRTDEFDIEYNDKTIYKTILDAIKFSGNSTDVKYDAQINEIATKYINNPHNVNYERDIKALYDVLINGNGSFEMDKIVKNNGEEIPLTMAYECYSDYKNSDIKRDTTSSVGDQNNPVFPDIEIEYAKYTMSSIDTSEPEVQKAITMYELGKTYKIEVQSIGLSNNAEFLTNMLQNAAGTLITVDLSKIASADYSWMSDNDSWLPGGNEKAEELKRISDKMTGYVSLREVDVATNTYLSEVTNTAAIKNAESQYESDMAKINRKEAKIDTTLAALESSRAAMTTEEGSLQNVIKDNVNLNFKLFS